MRGGGERQGGGEALSTLRETLSRPPVELAFGTSGLRGLVEDITDLEAWINARGFFDVLLARGPSGGGCLPGARVLLGCDLRPSSDGLTRSILRAVATAARDAGLEPVSLGPVPSPCLASAGLEARAPSVMVTGSHIPFDRNGIKFNRADGEVLKTDERDILSAVARVRGAAYALDSEVSPFGPDGMFRPGRSAIPDPADSAAARTAALAAWRRRWTDVLPADAFAGRRIVVYQHSAVGRELLVEVLRDLGAEVVPAGHSDVFVPVDTEDIGAAMIEVLRGLARAASASGRVDAVVSTDGDSDRPLVAAVVGGGSTAEVRVVGGDLLGLLVAEELGVEAVVVPVSASDAVDIRLGARGVRIRRTRIGSPHVIAAMEELRREAGTVPPRLVAWEANGGFLTGVDLGWERGTLRALPTRDSFLPILAVLRAAFRSGGGLAALLAGLPPRFGKAGLIDAFPPASSRAIVAAFSLPEGLDDVDLVPDVLAAQPAVTRERLAALKHRLDGALREFGLGPVVRISALDGVRAWCAGGEIIHLRPSGNAPQMRVYAVAGSAERAAAIVEAGIREPDGLLRRLERRFSAGPEASA